MVAFWSIFYEYWTLNRPYLTNWKSQKSENDFSFEIFEFFFRNTRNFWTFFYIYFFSDFDDFFCIRFRWFTKKLSTFFSIKLFFLAKLSFFFLDSFEKKTFDLIASKIGAKFNSLGIYGGDILVNFLRNLSKSTISQKIKIGKLFFIGFRTLRIF